MFFDLLPILSASPGKKLAGHVLSMPELVQPHGHAQRMPCNEQHTSDMPEAYSQTVRSKPEAHAQSTPSHA